MKIRIKLLSLIISAVICHGCIDPIDFEVANEFSDSIVVQGRVVNGDPSFVEVDISRFFDFSSESRQPLAVQEVIIFDDQGNQMELTTSTPGVFRQELDATTPVQAEVGRGYSIRVRTFDGRTIESTTEILLPNQVPQDIGIERISEVIINEMNLLETQQRIRLSVDTEVDAELNSGLYWDVRSIFRVTDSGINDMVQRTCYIDRLTSVDDIYVLDPREFSGNQIKDFELITIPVSAEFVEGYYFQVKQYSLTESALRYWNGIDILSEREGSVFDRPVGQVPSNLVNVDDPSNQVFGYFFASQEQVIRKRIPDELFTDVRTICPMLIQRFGALIMDSCGNGVNGDTGGACTCGLCCDCREDENSSQIRPDFFL